VPLRSPALTAAEPQLFVTDFRRSLAFYTGKLGFRVVFSYGDPPFYGQVQRGAARLNLRHVDSPVIDPALRDREVLLSAAITVEGVDQLFAEFDASGVLFHERLKDQPWGARTFTIRDPDGNLLLFAGSADQPAP
jgi:catechol 2,3-dioxygenase-like lactoylglutathione lyase family enzyme